MKKHIVVSMVAAVFSLGLLTIQFAQSALTEPQPQPRRQEAVGLMRTINTAEAVDRSKYGAYSSWETLLEHQSKFFDQWLTRISPEQRSARFSDLPEILPGWSLRFNVHADGKGYDVQLQDLTDKKCGYAAASDETGLIRQSMTIDCDIQSLPQKAD